MKLSNLVITPQRFVVIRDDLGQVKLADVFISQLLWEQGEDEYTIKTLSLGGASKSADTLNKFIDEVGPEQFASRDFFEPAYPNVKPNPRERKWNIVLPPLTDLLCFHRPATILEFLYKLRRCHRVKRIFIWISPSFIFYPHGNYLVGACEYLSDMLVHMKQQGVVAIQVRRPGGSIIYRQYKTKISDEDFFVEECNSDDEIKTESTISTPSDNTFKIELEEEELVARNSMKMPYEKAVGLGDGGGSIIYTPDQNDDFDEEDPDEDLCI